MAWLDSSAYKTLSPELPSPSSSSNNKCLCVNGTSCMSYYHILYALKWGILTISNTLLNCISLLAFTSFIQPLLKKIITPSHIHRHTQINIFKHCFESLYNYTTLAVLAQIQHAALTNYLSTSFLLTSPSTTKHRLRRRVAGPARLLRSGFWQSFF